jgi:uncharacterized membrane protein
MSTVRKFLTKKEEQEVIDAIREAERNTSGEIKVHLESSSKKDPLDRATEVFKTLEMNNTELRNGVLIYIAVKDRTMAIIGDQGIDKVVPEGFWNDSKDRILHGFSSGNFKQGLIDGVLVSGNALRKYFPYQEGDINEISDDISSKNEL